MLVNERGSTLLGELLALAIIGAALMVLLAGLSTSSLGVAVLEQRVSAENLARLQMEAIKAAPYSADPQAEPYPAIPDEGIYSLEVEISYWDPESEAFVAEPLELESGLQHVRVMVYSSQRPGAPVFVLEDYKGDRP